MKRFLALPLLLLACSDYNIHDQNDALGKYNPPNLGAEEKTDRIVQVTVPSVDVLWVIDNSCSFRIVYFSLKSAVSFILNIVGCVDCRVSLSGCHFLFASQLQNATNLASLFLGRKNDKFLL